MKLPALFSSTTTLLGQYFFLAKSFVLPFCFFVLLIVPLSLSGQRPGSFAGTEFITALPARLGQHPFLLDNAQLIIFSGSNGPAQGTIMYRAGGQLQETEFFVLGTSVFVYDLPFDELGSLALERPQPNGIRITSNNPIYVAFRFSRGAFDINDMMYCLPVTSIGKRYTLPVLPVTSDFANDFFNNIVLIGHNRNSPITIVPRVPLISPPVAAGEELEILLTPGQTLTLIPDRQADENGVIEFYSDEPFGLQTGISFVQTFGPERVSVPVTYDVALPEEMLGRNYSFWGGNVRQNTLVAAAGEQPTLIEWTIENEDFSEEVQPWQKFLIPVEKSGSLASNRPTPLFLALRHNTVGYNVRFSPLLPTTAEQDNARFFVPRRNAASPPTEAVLFFRREIAGAAEPVVIINGEEVTPLLLVADENIVTATFPVRESAVNIIEANIPFTGAVYGGGELSFLTLLPTDALYRAFPDDRTPPQIGSFVQCDRGSFQVDERSALSSGIADVEIVTSSNVSLTSIEETDRNTFRVLRFGVIDRRQDAAVTIRATDRAGNSTTAILEFAGFTVAIATTDDGREFFPNTIVEDTLHLHNYGKFTQTLLLQLDQNSHVSFSPQFRNVELLPDERLHLPLYFTAAAVPSISDVLTIEDDCGRIDIRQLTRQITRPDIFGESRCETGVRATRTVETRLFRLRRDGNSNGVMIPAPHINEGTMRITDIGGRVVFSQNIDSASSYPLPHLPSGAYIISLESSFGSDAEIFLSIQ